jgi:hypothetical protein
MSIIPPPVDSRLCTDASAHEASSSESSRSAAHESSARAIAACQEEFRRAPSCAEVRRRLALVLVEAGRLDEALELLRAELMSGDAGVTWLTEAVVRAMMADTLHTAGELAAIFAEILYRGTLTAPGDADGGGAEARPATQAKPTLSAAKLRHDIEQLLYLRHKGVLGAEIEPVIADYENVIARLAPLDSEARTQLSPDDEKRIGHVYNRIVYLRDTPRVPQALSPAWDRAVVEDRYLNHPAGVVVIDDFLTPVALDNLWHFCLESTVWSGNRYPHGRLGAFFLSGFNCPLLLQVAEEIRAAFPRVIGERHPLRQLWGFKYPPHLPGGSTIHADFAAVNVNFWITPDQSNLGNPGGGLVVYELDAPPEWDFVSYNERLDIIKEYLEQNNARAIRIPYRKNRAVIFNSDLFHATDEVNFRPGYEDRRINITMLYGVRENDASHPSLSAGGVPTAALSQAPSLWRSAALSRMHRRV